MKSEVQLHLFHSTCTCCWLLSNVKSQLIEVKDPSPIVDCLWGIIYQQLVSHFKFSIPCTFTFDEESGWNISDTDLPEVVLPNLTQLTNQDRKLQKSSIFPAFLYCSTWLTCQGEGAWEAVQCTISMRRSQESAIAII